MKKMNILPLGILLAALPMQAQDIYKMEMFTSSDLSGTARFVGLGGAMNALGADLSTMSYNPAAIGLYRKSDVALTGSMLMQPDAEDFWDREKTKASFDQIGFVYSAKMGGNLKFINFGFNYQKHKNFKNFIGVDNFNTRGLSQSMQMLDLSYIDGGILDLGYDRDRGLTTPLTCLGYDTGMLEAVTDDNDNVLDYNTVNANSYDYRRVQWGDIQAYDFNLSMNWNERVYAGFTFGVKNVDYHSATYYAENLTDYDGRYHMTNEEAITGTGYDIKLGLIVRPFETSPFRIGLAVHTPTFYDLSTDAYLNMRSPFPIGSSTHADVEIGNNEYEIRTPWKVNLSMATTIENILALDAEYEFSKYSSAKVSYYDDYYDYDSPFSNGHDDHYLNKEAEACMKPVHSFRFGAEARLSPNFYLRGGYNYVSAPFEEDAFLNLFTNSSSYYYNTNTDYVNLGEIQRATCGFGYKYKHFYADFAYQYQEQKGDLYTFHVPEEDSWNNRLDAANIKLVKHQLMLTLGYKF